MTRDLLWRGLLAGVIAALCAWLFARLLAEPQIDDLLAIAAERLDESEYEKLKAAALERRKMLAQSKKAKR